MKKTLTILLLLVAAFTSSTYAGGFTQLELAELLVNKAVAEGLIENLDYSDDEIIDMVMKYDFMSITDANSEMDVKEVRSVLGDYDTKKINIASDSLTQDEQVVKQNQTLLNQERKLSHEFMNRIDEEELYRTTYDFTFDSFGSVEGEQFNYSGHDVYPLINKYTYELYRIMGWYAKEYDLYVDVTSHSVSLFPRKSSVGRSKPLIEVDFIENSDFTMPDGIYYSVRIKVGRLYSIKYQGEAMEEYRAKIVETGFKQDHLVMALKDTLEVFINDELELNKFTETCVADVVENEGKSYSHSKKRYETFDNYEVFISKTPGLVFYRLTFDLSQWWGN